MYYAQKGMGLPATNTDPLAQGILPISFAPVSHPRAITAPTMQWQPSAYNPAFASAYPVAKTPEPAMTQASFSRVAPFEPVTEQQDGGAWTNIFGAAVGTVSAGAQMLAERKQKKELEKQQKAQNRMLRQQQLFSGSSGSMTPWIIGGAAILALVAFGVLRK